MAQRPKQPVANQIRESGNTMAQAGSNNQNALQQRLAMAAMFQNMNGNQLGGYALGKVLKALLQQYLSHQANKSKLKSSLEAMTPEERARYLEKIRLETPEQYSYAQKKYDKWFGGDESAQPTSDANPSVGISPSGRAAIEQDLPLKQGLLGNVQPQPNYDFKDIPEPFNEFGNYAPNQGWQLSRKPWEEEYEKFLGGNRW